MKQLSLCVSLAIALSSTQALADLTLPSYVAAKQSYGANDCKQTLALLSTYMEEDKAYLEGNASIRAQLDKVVAHCKAETSSGGQLFMSGATSVPTSKPQLP